MSSAAMKLCITNHLFNEISNYLSASSSVGMILKLSLGSIPLLEFITTPTAECVRLGAKSIALILS